MAESGWNITHYFKNKQNIVFVISSYHIRSCHVISYIILYHIVVL